MCDNLGLAQFHFQGKIQGPIQGRSRSGVCSCRPTVTPRAEIFRVLVRLSQMDGTLSSIGAQLTRAETMVRAERLSPFPNAEVATRDAHILCPPCCVRVSRCTRWTNLTAESVSFLS
jgi:hypothetical protein